MLDAVDPLHAPGRHSIPLPEAVVTIVTGQILSNAAATIVKRLHLAGEECESDELFAIP